MIQLRLLKSWRRYSVGRVIGCFGGVADLLVRKGFAEYVTETTNSGADSSTNCGTVDANGSQKPVEYVGKRSDARRRT